MSCLQRSLITIWPTFQHHLRTTHRSSTPMTSPSTHPDQWWLIKAMASASICRKSSTTSTTKTVNDNGQIYSNTLHAWYSRVPHTSIQVRLADQVLQQEKKPNMFGLTLDTQRTFTQHCKYIAVKVQQYNNVMKALAGSTWGCDKYTLLTTYQVIGRSILGYRYPVWTPSRMDTNWSRLQRAQISALRIATGCLKMADVAELHQDAR